MREDRCCRKSGVVENVEVLELDEVSAAANWMLGDLEQATRWGFVRPSTNSEGSFPVLGSVA